MDGQKPKKQFIWIRLLAALALLWIIRNLEFLSEKVPLLHILGLLYLAALIAIGVLAVKLWKKNHQEIVEESQLPLQGAQMSILQCALVFYGSIHISVELLRQQGFSLFLLAFCILMLLLAGLPLLATLLNKYGVSSNPNFLNIVSFFAQLPVFLFTLAGFAFLSVYCYFALLHRIWILLPLGLFLGAIYIRYVAAFLFMWLKKQTNETDPWDRPDKTY